MITSPPFEDKEEDEDYSYIILIVDHPEGKHALLAPRSLLQIRVEGKEFPGLISILNTKHSLIQLSNLNRIKYYPKVGVPERLNDVG